MGPLLKVIKQGLYLGGGSTFGIFLKTGRGNLIYGASLGGDQIARESLRQAKLDMAKQPRSAQKEKAIWAGLVRNPQGVQPTG